MQNTLVKIIEMKDTNTYTETHTHNLCTHTRVHLHAQTHRSTGSFYTLKQNPIANTTTTARSYLIQKITFTFPVSKSK